MHHDHRDDHDDMGGLHRDLAATMSGSAAGGFTASLTVAV